MHKRQLGPFEVSALGLGCMNMSMGYGPTDDKQSERVLLEALETGYDFFDTAAMYGMGHNETLIGKTLSHRRSEFVLASKCGISKDTNFNLTIDGSPEAIKRTCEESLRRLNTDVIDLYYLHRPDPKVPIEESVGALADLVQEGKIRTVGLSEVSNENLRRAHATYPITALQSEYSLWSRTPERKVLETCRELGITFVPFSPLGRGFLTGKAQDITHLAEDDIRQSIARPRFEPEAFAKNSTLLAPLKEKADAMGCSLAQLSLAWLLAIEDRKLIPIPGTKHLNYMQENAGAETILLDSQTASEIGMLISEDQVIGARYSDAAMTAADSEKD